MTEGVRVVEPVELAAMKAVSMVARQDRKGSRIDWIFTVCGGRSPS